MPASAAGGRLGFAANPSPSGEARPFCPHTVETAWEPINGAISNDRTISGQALPKMAAIGTTIRQANITSARKATTVDDSTAFTINLP
jgi:hypothetical protein